MIAIVTDPLLLFKSWFEQAKKSESWDAQSMCLSTVGQDNQPSSRIVLLRDVRENGFIFYTNTMSRKGQELEQNTKAALNFHWNWPARQVRLEGEVTPVSDAVADAYFCTRPRMSRISSWASLQSRPLGHAETLKQRVLEFDTQYPDDVPRPPHWSGYQLSPHRIEFWQMGEHRLHDRLCYKKSGNRWRTQRLYP